MSPNLSIEYVDINSITPYEHNARAHKDADVEAIKNSILKFGFKDPIGIWHNTIVEGHGRLLAAKALGMDKVPVIRLDDLSDEQRRAYALAHNKTAELSDWDWDVLASELEELSDFDMSEFGFDVPEIDVDEPPKDPEIAEDDASEPPEEPKACAGDIWELGKHRLICGDCTDTAIIDRLMDGVKADLVFTDPPYGMGKESAGVENDNQNLRELLEFNRQWVPLTFEALKDKGSWYCWGIDEPLMDIYSEILKPMIRDKKIAFRNLLTWDKGTGFGQRSEEMRMYAPADEKCLFVMVGGESVQGFTVNKEDYSESMDKVREYLEEEIARLNQSDEEIARALGYTCGRTVNHWRSKSQFALPTKENYEALREYGKTITGDLGYLKRDYEDLKRDFYAGRAFFDNTHDNMNNVWHFPRTSEKERKDTGGHATPKPIALCARAIKSSSRKGEIVLDVFGGSGSTLMACEQLGRKCYMCEISPKYIDVIITRWEKFTGQKAKKIND